MALGILLVLYSALGFLVVPVVLRTQLPARLGAVLGRPVRVRAVRLNPFALSLTLDGFAVQEADGADFLGWERLYLRVRPSSLVSRTLAFRAIELTRPFGRVVAERGGRFNFSDLEARLGAGSPAPQGKPEPRPLRIDHLAIQGARITLLDRAMAEPFTTTLGPLTLDLTGFSTEASGNPYAFAGRTEAGESFQWNGTFALEPLASQGSFRVDRLSLPKYHPFFSDQVAFQLPAGRVSVQAGYRFQWGPGTHVLQLQDGAVQLTDLRLAQGQAPAALELPRAELRGAQADLIARTASIASLRLQDGRVKLTRAANGDLDLVKLLTPRPDPHPAPAAAPFALTLKELGLTGFRVDFEDQAPVRPVHARVEDLALTLKDLSLDPAANPSLQLSLRLNGKARLTAEGTVAPFRPAAELKVKLDGLDLPAFDPYLDPFAAVRVNRGSLSLDGQISGAFESRPTDFAAFRGSLRLERFQAADSVRGEPFLGYRSLALTGLDLRTNPDRVAIATVDLVEPDQRLVIAQDGSTNVARALRLEAAPAPTAAKPPLSALGSALPPSQGPPLRLSIGRTRMSSGRLSFVDRSLEPNAALLVTNLEGSATSLSTEPDSQSALDFKGLAGGLAPLRLQGLAMPLRKDQDTDVTLTIQGSELQDFSPYAGKFLGYAIRKGKLSVDAHVAIRQRQLEANLKTRLDQFYLGDPSHSPDALHVPVRLCLAVLRDRDGIIDLELPVSGSLDDPDLHYGKLVWKAVLNVLTKVATSPFSLLAKLGGHPDHDLSYVSFAPGSALPDPVAVEKAQALARAMAERPELGLEAEGSADPAADAGALKQEALAQLLLDLRNAGAAEPAEALPPEERGPWLAAAFRKAFPPAPGAPEAPPPPPAEMEQQLLGTLNVTGDDLAQLADLRTKALLKLVLDAKVDPRRLFEVGGSAQSSHPAGSRVYLGLR